MPYDDHDEDDELVTCREPVYGGERELPLVFLLAQKNLLPTGQHTVIEAPKTAALVRGQLRKITRDLKQAERHPAP